MARNRPWMKIDLHYETLPLVMIAQCGAVYPWVIAVLRRHKNEADDLDIDPRICAHQLSLTLETATRQIDAMKSHGLVVKGEDGFWRDPNWEEAAPDARPPSYKRGANKTATAHGTERDPMGSQPDPIKSRDPMGSHGSRARVDQDLDLEGDLETPEEDPKRAARIEPSPRVHAAKRGGPLADGNGKPGTPDTPLPDEPQKPRRWFDRIGEEHGAPLPPYRTDESGRRVWAFGTLKLCLQRLWPNEPVLMPGGPGANNISRFINELTAEDPADIDRLLLTVAPDGSLLEPARLDRPYALKQELFALKNPGVHRRSGKAGAAALAPSDPRAEGLADLRARLAKDPDEVWDLAQALLVAGEAPEPWQLALFVAEYQRRNVRLPPLFQRAQGAQKATAA